MELSQLSLITLGLEQGSILSSYLKIDCRKYASYGWYQVNC